MTIFWLMVCDLLIWFCRADITVCLYSQALVMEGHLDPVCYSVWSSATHLFHIRMTVNGCWTVWRAISRDDNPHSLWTMILPLSNSDICWHAFFLIIWARTLYSDQTLTLQSTIRIRNSPCNIFLCSVSKYCFSLLHRLNVIKY